MNQRVNCSSLTCVYPKSNAEGCPHELIYRPTRRIHVCLLHRRDAILPLRAHLCWSTMS